MRFGITVRGVTQYIRYSASGEPLLHPHLCEMLLYAVERSGVTVTLTTNGTLMNEERIGQLLLTGVDLIDISIDAHMPETYANIRVHGDLNVTRGNVLRLLQRVKEDSRPHQSGRELCRAAAKRPRDEGL